MEEQDSLAVVSNLSCHGSDGSSGVYFDPTFYISTTIIKKIALLNFKQNIADRNHH